LWIPKSHATFATFATTHATNLDDTLAVKQDEVRLGLLGPVETFTDFWNIGIWMEYSMTPPSLLGAHEVRRVAGLSLEFALSPPLISLPGRGMHRFETSD
jgi:hypothetical protein